jgi:hypothetical protein
MRLSSACVVAGIGWAAWAVGCSSSSSTGGSGGNDASDDGAGGSDDGTTPSNDATSSSGGGTDGSDASNQGDTTTPGEGGNEGGMEGGMEGSVEAGSPYHAYCTAYIAIASTCGGGGPTTVSQCEGYLAGKSSCAELATCIACAGASPVASCNDAGGPPHIAGCAASCDNLQCANNPDGGDGGDGSPGSFCSGTFLPVASVSTSASSPAMIAAGGLNQPALIYGPARDGGGGYGELGGFVEVTGLIPNAVVSASIIVGNCDPSAACATGLDFEFGAFDAGVQATLTSAGAGCGSIPVTADGAGNLFIHIGKTGDSGAENNVGIRLSAPPPTDAGPPDAPAGGGDGGGGDAGPTCPGVQIHAGAGGTSASSPITVTGGITPMAMGIFGPALGGSGYGELSGYIEVTGLMPNGVVSASMVVYPSCADPTACPSDLSATFGDFDAGTGDTLQSTSGCAQIPVTADGNGNLFIRIGKSGDSGVPDDNVGIVLRPPPPPPDGGPTDAPPG